MASLITTGTLIKTHLEGKWAFRSSIYNIQQDGVQTINQQTGEVPYLQQTLSISYTLVLGFFEDLKPEGDVIITKAKPRLL